MSKFKREDKILYDKKQLFFTGNGDLKSNEFKFAKVEQKGFDFNKKVTCPFCLAWLPLTKFLISTKKGFNHGLGKCSVCGQGMQLKTLFNLGKWSAEQYAKFVVDYPAAGFFKKIDFEVWKRRLNVMGWGQKFWLEYHRLNPKITEKESREDDVKWDEYDRDQARREFEQRQRDF